MEIEATSQLSRKHVMLPTRSAEKSGQLEKSCETTTRQAVWQPLYSLPAGGIETNLRRDIVQQQILAGKIHYRRNIVVRRFGLHPSCQITAAI